MGKVTGFKEYARELPERRPVEERVNDYREVYKPFADEKVRTQAARCMDCGIPFCHTGCPVNNIIPDWNDLVYHDEWKEAIRVLHSTNNFPEFTGRICPAPCEAACVLAINEPAVTIKVIEKTIVDRAWDEGWITPQMPETSTGKRIAVVGSGPAGLAAAQQLNRAGHAVKVFEKADRIGGLLRYGIPDFKMEKSILDRRLEQIQAEGVLFQTGVHVGKDITADDLRKEFDAVLLAAGAEAPRDLKVPGRELARHPLRHGLSAAAEQAQRRRCCSRSDSRHRQARGHHRRRRHRRRLPGHLPPAEGQVRAAIRDHAHAAGRAPSPARPGRFGRCSCAPKARTKRAAIATGPSAPSRFSGDAARQREDSFMPCASGRRTKFDPLPGTEHHDRSRHGAAGHGLYRARCAAECSSSLASSWTRAATSPRREIT